VYRIYRYPIPDWTCKRAIDSWYTEVKLYDFDVSNPYEYNWPRGTGHFVQLVWKSSALFGCGIGKANVSMPRMPGGVGGCKVGANDRGRVAQGGVNTPVQIRRPGGSGAWGIQEGGSREEGGRRTGRHEMRLRGRHCGGASQPAFSRNPRPHFLTTTLQVSPYRLMPSQQPSIQ
jgi:hypothetical protein